MQKGFSSCSGGLLPLHPAGRSLPSSSSSCCHPALYVCLAARRSAGRHQGKQLPPKARTLLAMLTPESLHQRCLSLPPVLTDGCCRFL